jgi:SAM-dependent methyltransferase
MRYHDPDNYQKIMREAFSACYRHGRDSWTNEPAMSDVGRMFARQLDGPSLRILDIGTGRGRDALAYARMGHHVLGIDFVASAEWDQVILAAPDKIAFVATDFLHFKSTQAFDAVCDNGCLHHQHPDCYGSYLRKARTLLRDGGIYCVSLFGAKAQAASGYLLVEKDGRLHRTFTRGEAEELLSAYKLDPVAATTIQRRRADLQYLIIIAHAV